MEKQIPPPRFDRNEFMVRVSGSGTPGLEARKITLGKRRLSWAQAKDFRFLAGVVIAFLALCAAAQDLSPQQLVQAVVENELSGDKTDHSRWIYRDHKQVPGRDAVTIVIETAGGSVQKTVELNGQPLNAEQRQQDEANIQKFVTDPGLQQKQRQDGQQDAKKARDLMAMLPGAFLWTEAGEANGTITLDFKPNPAFRPPTRDARVFAAMAGQMTIDQKQKRLKSLSGALTTPVLFGWGFFGKLQKGGTFRIDRLEVSPGVWRTASTHVHIQGKALIFKSLNEQQDETTSDYKPAPASLSLSQAAEMLKSGAAEEELAGSHP